jgi:hypothetical protein
LYRSGNVLYARSITEKISLACICRIFSTNDKQTKEYKGLTVCLIMSGKYGLMRGVSHKHR